MRVWFEARTRSRHGRWACTRPSRARSGSIAVGRASGLEANDLWSGSSRSEQALLKGEANQAVRGALQLRVEALYAFAWALSLIDELDFAAPCPDIVVARYPDLRRDEDASSFRERARLRTADEILEAADLAYCLHWALRQAELDCDPRPGRVDAYVVTERRLALDWILSEEEWHALTLDT